MNKTLLMLIAAGLLWYFVFSQKPDKQIVVSDSGEITVGEYQITPLEAFSLKARVLSKENYGLDREADLSPTDLALGWGRMADESVLESFDISQRNRWYFWRASQMPIPEQEVIASSANMHIIPANEAVAWQLDRVRKGDRVQLKGNLVRVDAEDGWRWVSSLSRTDTGKGSCELFLVESLSIDVL